MAQDLPKSYRGRDASFRVRRLPQPSGNIDAFLIEIIVGALGFTLYTKLD
jgi:hypothetical protein